MYLTQWTFPKQIFTTVENNTTNEHKSAAFITRINRGSPYDVGYCKYGGLLECIWQKNGRPVSKLDFRGVRNPRKWTFWI